MFLVCQSIWPPSLLGWENHAIFATRSPTAIRNIRPLRLRRKQIPETSRRGTSTTRHTRSLFLLDLLFSTTGEALRGNERPSPLGEGFKEGGPNTWRPRSKGLTPLQCAASG